MLLVLTIIGVLVAATVAALSGRGETLALRVATRDLAAAINHAAATARSSGTAHRITFADDGRSYRVESRTNSGSYEAAPGRSGMRRLLGRGIRIERIEDDRGAVDPPLEFGDEATFSGRITLADARSETLAVEVMPETGQVILHERGNQAISH